MNIFQSDCFWEGHTSKVSSNTPEKKSLECSTTNIGKWILILCLCSLLCIFLFPSSQYLACLTLRLLFHLSFFVFSWSLGVRHLDLCWKMIVSHNLRRKKTKNENKLDRVHNGPRKKKKRSSWLQAWLFFRYSPRSSSGRHWWRPRRLQSAFLRWGKPENALWLSAAAAYWSNTNIKMKREKTIIVYRTPISYFNSQYADVNVTADKVGLFAMVTPSCRVWLHSDPSIWNRIVRLKNDQ